MSVLVTRSSNVPPMSSEKKSTSESTANQDSYIVVARRYRPQSFDDLIGQPQVTLALGNAIKQNRVGHAYLFTGARGVGKTSSARIFAKCLNCESGPSISPCQTCDICQGIASGEDVDVLEIDGASNRGIDEIRQLRSNVNVRPSRARFKIYIIDEVHMLTTAAFNALLKTLEEPPEHVKFVFCTTDPEKIPITVLSRCQRFDFVPIETDEIKGRLQGIAQSENVEADDDALALLARRAAGSVRDSQSLLEQLLSFCESRITIDDVNSLLGTADRAIIRSISQSLAGKDARQALIDAGEAISAGVDPGQLAEQLLGYFRDAMVVAVGGDQEQMLYSEPADFSQLQTMRDELGLHQILAMVQILDQSIVKMRQSVHIRTILELAIVRICNLDNLQQISDLIQQVGQAAPPSKVGTRDRNAGGLKKNGKVDRPESVSKPPVAKVPAAIQENKTENRETERPQAEPSISLDDTNVSRVWRQALAETGDTTADLAGEFERLELPSPSQLVVTLPDPYSCDACNRPERKERLERALAAITGASIRVDFVASKQSPATATPRKPVMSKRQQIREIEQHPMVRAAIEMFDGEVVNLRAPRKPR